MADQSDGRREGANPSEVPTVALTDLENFESTDWSLDTDTFLSETAFTDPFLDMLQADWSSPGSWEFASIPQRSQSASDSGLLLQPQIDESPRLDSGITLIPGSASSAEAALLSTYPEISLEGEHEITDDNITHATPSSSTRGLVSTDASGDVDIPVQNVGDRADEQTIAFAASDATPLVQKQTLELGISHTGGPENNEILHQRSIGIPIQPKPSYGHQHTLNGDSETSTDSAPLGPLSTRIVLKPRPKRKSMNEAGKQKVKKVRQAGSCIRCRMYNESCDENTPCGRCIAVAGTAKIFIQPCYRERLDDILAFRAGNSRAGKIRSENSKFRWSSDDYAIKVVDLCYAFKDISLQAESKVSIKCRKFIPQPWDVLEEPWPTRDGGVVTLHSTPYACYDVDDSIDVVGQYISRFKFALLEESMDSIADNIQKRTHQEALRYATYYPDSAVATALNIKAGCYFSRSRMLMSGKNSLELEYFDNDQVRSHGKSPIPAVLDYQIDFMAIQYMLKQMGMVVKRLKSVIFGKARNRNWYEAYLTSFLLLSSLEMAQSRQVEIMKRWDINGNNVSSQVRSTSDRMMQEWSYSAKVLIYHYRAILKGMTPFALDSATSSDELKKSAELDKEAMEYIFQLKTMIHERGGELQRSCTCDLDNRDGKPFIWVSQLYIDKVD